MKKSTLQFPPARYLMVVLTLAAAIILQPTLFAEILPLPQPDPELTLLEVASIPVLSTEVASLSAQLVLNSSTAKAVLVTDEASGAILLEKNKDLVLPPASTTKLVSALVAREHYQLDDVLEVREEAFTQGAVMDLQPGEMISFESILKGMLIPSANDAAFLLANNYPGGYQGFVKAMNHKAQELGLSDSRFTNPSGLDQPQHLMTVRDLSLVMREVQKDPVLAEIVGSDKAQVSDLDQKYLHQLRTTHELLRNNEIILGGKTGTTESAGQVLVTVVEIKGHRLQIVLMGSRDRYAETLEIIAWIEDHIEWQTPVLF